MSKRTILNSLFLAVAIWPTAISLASTSIGSQALDFGSSAGQFSFPTGDITNAVTSGANLVNGPIGFDIWDETTGAAVPGGANDIFFSFETISEDATDTYGGNTLDPRKGTTHDQVQSTTGLRGTVPINQSGSNNSTTGDTHGYKVTVTFANHVALTAADTTVLQTSVNTTGEAFESTAINFLNGSGVAYGSATYGGYWASTPQGSNSGTNTTSVSSNPWATTGSGVYVAQNTSVIDTATDSANPVGTSNAATDNFDPNASTDAGLAAADPIGGFSWTVLLEDVATTTVDDAVTTSFTTFTATLNGLNLADVCLVVVPEPSSSLLLGLGLLVFLGGRRRSH